MVVFPSWLPFFLQNPQTQKRTQRKRDNAGRNARKKPALIQNPAFIPQIPPPIDCKTIVFGCDKIPGWEGGDGSEKYPPNEFHLLTE